MPAWVWQIKVKLLRGLHTGGSCFYYETFEVAGGKQVRVNDSEDTVARMVFARSTGGAALKTIAKTLRFSSSQSALFSERGFDGVGFCDTLPMARIAAPKCVIRVPFFA